MSEAKKNPAPMRQTSERECGTMHSNETLSCGQDQYKPESGKRQAKTVESLLKRGEVNAISTAELMEILGCNERTLRSKIARERERGAPIISRMQGGYFLPSDGDIGRKEIERSKAFLIARGTSAIRSALNFSTRIAIDGQEQLPEVEK